MKKVYTSVMLISFGSLCFVGCSSSKKSTKGILGSDTSVTASVSKTVATVVGLILLSKLIKSVLGTIGTSKSFASLTQDQNFTQNFNENTRLSSLAQNDLLKTALQVVVAEHYRIPLATVANNYNSLNTVGDLATFIGKNADAKILSAIK